MAKKNSRTGIILLFILLSIGLLGSTGWLMTKARGQNDILKSVQEQLKIAQAAKANLELQVQDLRTKNKQLTAQIQELNKSLQEMKDKMPEISDSLQSEENKKIAYLTFDDGPSANTIPILDFLKANHIKATFFVLKKEGYDDIYKRIVDEGHTIALHSSTHDYAQIYQNVDTFMNDMNTLSEHIKKLTGVETKIMRFPGGSNNRVSHRYGGSDVMSKIIPTVEEAGLVYYDWNVDSQDAAKGVQDTQVIINSVLSQAKYNNNAVILMHDAAAKTTTVKALPSIVEGLKEQGFVFEALTTESEPVKFN